MPKPAVAMLFLLAMSGLPQAQAAVSASDPGTAVDRAVRQAMAERKMPGVSVAVIQHSKIIKETSYGHANLELSVPSTNATLYTLASTTKEFTGVAIMKLVEDGKISLDASVRDYLPELPAAWSPVTIRHCLSHTSGLPDGDAPDDVNVLPLAGTRDELLTLLATRPVAEPGVKTVYNQTEFMLLGDIIARVSGLSYQDFINQRLLQPLGIASMRWGDGWTVIPGRASLYTALQPTSDRSKLQLDANGQPVYSTTGIHAFGQKVVTDWLMPSAGLNGNIDAMARWEVALWSGQVIKPASLALMGTPYRLRDGKADGFGLAFVPELRDGQRMVSSGGGAAVWLSTLPDRQLTVIVLSNLQASKPQALVASILDIYAPPQSR